MCAALPPDQLSRAATLGVCPPPLPAKFTNPETGTAASCLPPSHVVRLCGSRPALSWLSVCLSVAVCTHHLSGEDYTEEDITTILSKSFETYITCDPSLVQFRGQMNRHQFVHLCFDAGLISRRFPLSDCQLVRELSLSLNVCVRACFVCCDDMFSSGRQTYPLNFVAVHLTLFVCLIS